MLWLGREMSHEDRHFLTEVVVVLVAALLVLFSGPYTTLVVLGLALAYTFLTLWILGKGGMKEFDRFVDGLMFRKTAIILATPALVVWYMS